MVECCCVVCHLYLGEARSFLLQIAGPSDNKRACPLDIRGQKRLPFSSHCLARECKRHTSQTGKLVSSTALNDVLVEERPRSSGAWLSPSDIVLRLLDIGDLRL